MELKEEIVKDEYLEKWNKVYPELQAGRIVYDTQKSPYRLKADTTCIRCWSDETLVRSQMPKDWWMTSDYKVISVKWNEPRLVPTHGNLRGEERYTFWYEAVGGEKKLINLSVTALASLVYGYRAFCSADTLLKSKGLEAIGTKREEVQCHHIREYQGDAPIKYNADPMYTVFLTHEWHKLLTAFKNFNSKSEQQQIDLYKRLFALMEKDDVDLCKFVFTVNGRVYLDCEGSIDDTNNADSDFFVFSPEALKQTTTKALFNSLEPEQIGKPIVFLYEIED